MRKIFINIFLFAIIFVFQINPALSVIGNQQVQVQVPATNSVVVTGGNLSANIDINTGALSSSLTSTFNVSTNSNQGLIAEFSANVNTASGSYNGMIGTTANSNTGSTVLTNINFMPTTSNVDNGLSNSPSPTLNPNVIGYQISFANQSGSNPVFASAGSTVASAQVIPKKGNTNILVTINSIRSGTFDQTTDTAGSYQLNIYCTVYNP